MRRAWAEAARRAAAWTLLLRPLALLWRLGSALLMAWHGLRKPVKVEGLRVVSVGNLSVGGTGKSALARALAREGKRRGFRPALLLRGYQAGPGPRPLLVSKGKGPLVPASVSGDEAWEHALGLPGCLVLVDPDRLRGAHEARRLGADFLVLDDGFQRRWQLARDFDLLSISWDELGTGERLVPEGPWREPWAAAAEADALALFDAPQAHGPLPAPFRSLSCCELAYKPRRLRPWTRGHLGHPRPLGLLKGREVLALSGLAAPQRFEGTLQACGAEVHAWRFADHHAFSPAELASPPRAGVAVVTTLKDAARLPAAWAPSAPVWVLEADLASRPASALPRLLAKALA